MSYDRCTSKPENESARLALLHELELLGGERFPELDRLTSLAADICHADLSAITLYDVDDGVRVSVSSGEVSIGPVPREQALCTHILLKPETLVINDAIEHPTFRNNRFVHEEPRLRSYVGVPVGAEKALPAGVMCITHSRSNAFGPEDIAHLEKVAALVDAFLETRIAELRARRAALKTQAERRRQHLFELIFEAIQEGVNVYTPDGRIVESNPAAMRFLNLKRDEQMGRMIGDPRWKIVRPDGSVLPKEEYPVSRTLATGEAVNDVLVGVEMPGGERRWISVNTNPVRDPATGAMSHAAMTFKDITGQHLAEEKIIAQNIQLAQALSEAEKANKAKTDFMGVMSHELRTPMNAMLSCALLLSQSSLDPVQRRTLGVLEDAGRQMLAVLNDLLDVSSLDADKVRIDREPVSLLRLIEDAAVIWAADVKAKGLSMSVMIDPSLAAPRKVDSARLLQVIGNLMANAIKFTASGSITIQAWPERSRKGVECVGIEVEDTGAGVPKEAAERIFSPFEQVDVSSKRKHGGLGLGLYVARRLAVAMGGDIELETTLGQGSRFTVRVEAPQVGQMPTMESAGAANDEASAMQTKDILCIDDNPRNLYVLGAMLRAAGHRAEECSSGAAGLKRLTECKFDVILLDMVMPDMDGLDVLAALRRMGGLNAATPVIACTANVLPDQVESYRKAGTTAVLAKPIDIRAMLLAVAEAA